MSKEAFIYHLFIGLCCYLGFFVVALAASVLDSNPNETLYVSFGLGVFAVQIFCSTLYIVRTNRKKRNGCAN
ncbi:MAG: hypothetical protein AB1512_16430 [Thermodesulfobacteriota bacterium]